MIWKAMALLIVIIIYAVVAVFWSLISICIFSHFNFLFLICHDKFSSSRLIYFGTVWSEDTSGCGHAFFCEINISFLLQVLIIADFYPQILTLMRANIIRKSWRPYSWNSHKILLLMASTYCSWYSGGSVLCWHRPRKETSFGCFAVASHRILYVHGI